MIDQDLIKIITTKVPITVGRQYFKDTVTDIENGDIESSATQVENCDSGVGFLVETVGQRGGSWLVDDAFHFQSGNFTCIFRGLPL